MARPAHGLARYQHEAPERLLGAPSRFQRIFRPAPVGVHELSFAPRFDETRGVNDVFDSFRSSREASEVVDRSFSELDVRERSQKLGVAALANQRAYLPPGARQLLGDV
jgi:hypothetical protein